MPLWMTRCHCYAFAAAGWAASRTSTVNFGMRPVTGDFASAPMASTTGVPRSMPTSAVSSAEKMPGCVRSMRPSATFWLSPTEWRQLPPHKEFFHDFPHIRKTNSLHLIRQRPSLDDTHTDDVDKARQPQAYVTTGGRVQAPIFRFSGDSSLRPSGASRRPATA